MMSRMKEISFREMYFNNFLKKIIIFFSILAFW